MLHNDENDFDTISSNQIPDFDTTISDQGSNFDTIANPGREEKGLVRIRKHEKGILTSIEL